MRSLQKICYFKENEKKSFLEQVYLFFQKTQIFHVFGNFTVLDALFYGKIFKIWS